MVLALVLIIIGAVIQGSFYGSSSLLYGYISVPAGLTMAFGALLLVASLIVLVCVYCESASALLVYMLLLSTLIIIELAAAIASLVMKTYILSMITDSLRSAQLKYTDNHSASLTWNSVQRDFKCCGVDHYKEWFHYFGNSSVPDTCCVDYSVDCGSLAAVNDNLLKTSCSVAIELWTKSHQIPATILFIFVLFMQFFSLLLSLCHSRSLRRYDWFEGE